MLRLARTTSGDTIVEVLISISVAAFAIGTSYALANQSLQHAISARERNQAITYIDNQIADLKTRYQTLGPVNFGNSFTGGAEAKSSPSRGQDFCLVDGVTSSTDANWPAQPLVKINSAATANDFTNYASTKCIQTDPTSNTNYYIDITPMVTTYSLSATPKTVFQIAVRWEQINGNQHNQASVFYRF